MDAKGLVEEVEGGAQVVSHYAYSLTGTSRIQAIGDLWFVVICSVQYLEEKGLVLFL